MSLSTYSKFSAALGFTAFAFLGLNPDAQAAVVDAEGYHATYTVNLPSYAVDHIVLYEFAADYRSITWYFSAGVGETTIVNPFVDKEPVLSTFAFGIVSDLQGDAPGQQHLVLFTNNNWAASAKNIAFGTLFPTTLEDRLISDIVEGLAFGNPDSVRDAAASELFDFGTGDAVTSPNGPISFQLGDNFTAIAFSNGAIIGGGQSFATPAVPELSTWTMMILGAAGLGFASYRRAGVRTGALAKAA